MESLEKKIREKAGEENKLACADALKIAAELNIPPSSVGREADRLKIKIKSCQLGCFK